jgi:DnaJ like chaperone protein
MSIWGKIIGGVAGFAVGGPLGAILGAACGHAIDRKQPGKIMGPNADSIQTRQTAFTIAVVVLSAKMAKADGYVTREEVDTFKRIFDIPENEMSDIGQLFNEARKDAEGFEPYAKQIGGMFGHDQVVCENLLGGLFQIALADGVIHPNELNFLKKVSRAFNLNNNDFNRIQSAHMTTHIVDPYQILGITRKTSDKNIKIAYKKLSRENHPDTLIAKGMPQEFIDIANEKMASINAAYDQVSKEQSL